jgi:hypothetical protein
MKNYSVIVACLLFRASFPIPAFANRSLHKTDHDVIRKKESDLFIFKENNDAV